MSLSNLGTVALHAAKVPTNVFSSTLICILPLDYLCASHVFVTLEAIIHDSSVSDGALPASDQFGGSKAGMSGYNCSAQCFEAWYAAHLTTLYNTIV